MQRPRGRKCGNTLRQRYDEVGLPCSSTMGSPSPTSTYAISRPRTRCRRFLYGNAAEIMLVSPFFFERSNCRARPPQYRASARTAAIDDSCADVSAIVPSRRRVQSSPGQAGQPVGHRVPERARATWICHACRKDNSPWRAACTRHRAMNGAARPLTATRPGETVAATPRALALGVILSAQLLVVLNVSIVNVALPSIQGDLDLSSIGTQWLVTAY